MGLPDEFSNSNDDGSTDALMLDIWFLNGGYPYDGGTHDAALVPSGASSSVRAEEPPNDSSDSGSDSSDSDSD